MWSESRGQKSKKTNAKIKAQNEKIAETDIDIWC